MTLSAKDLGRAVAEVRKLRGLTQREVAERARLTVNYISLVENGERAVSQDALNRLAGVLRVPAGWIAFLGGTVETAGRAKDLFAELNEATRDLMLSVIEADTGGLN
jgi:transcriptional regulator with XRE-family HTH domain